MINVMSPKLDCWQSAFSVKIHLDLISACRIANTVLEVKNPLSAQKQCN